MLSIYPMKYAGSIIKDNGTETSNTKRHKEKKTPQESVTSDQAMNIFVKVTVIWGSNTWPMEKPVKPLAMFCFPSIIFDISDKTLHLYLP